MGVKQLDEEGLSPKTLNILHQYIKENLRAGDYIMPRDIVEDTDLDIVAVYRGLEHILETEHTLSHHLMLDCSGCGCRWYSKGLFDAVACPECGRKASMSEIGDATVVYQVR